MPTVPPGRLAPLLTASAEGYYATEAAAQLLTSHGMWLHRSDFLADCVWLTLTGDGPYEGVPATPHYIATTEPDDLAGAAVMWDAIPTFLADAPCSGSERRILSLVAELAGWDTATPLDELLSGLDDINSELVLDAIAHALVRRIRHEGPAR